MSKKKIYNKHLEMKKGRFYIVNKHPGLIVFKNDKKNIYLAVVTGTSKHKHQTKLKHPTEKKVEASYVNNRPVLARENILVQRNLSEWRFIQMIELLFELYQRENR